MSSESPAVRIGIDVGGTFTHAVAVDNRTLTVIAKVCRPTTHAADDGVAEGIWQCLEELLAAGIFGGGDVVFVAHSTTQATNALLEGDVATVTLVGLGEGVSGAQAKRELSMGNVEITGGKFIPLTNIFFSPEEAAEGVKKHLETAAAGAAFVVAEPFSVDDPEREQQVAAVIADTGHPVTASYEVSGLYGLRARARTSVVNASILPKMMDVAEKTRGVVSRLGLAPALMVMRSDGGVMNVELMRRTPILTILSGPAAGVSAAILYEKISNGFFVEVGGTSTDISLILDGRPQRRQAAVGGNILYLKTLDVRTLGVAGGSMIRLSGGRITDVGPRSAHIAGLPYSCFMEPELLTQPELRLIAPKPGDPADYAVVDTGSGTACALTTTCAANALGMLPEGDYSCGNRDTARKAFEPLAAVLGCGVDDAAREVLRIASNKVADICRKLREEYAPAASLVVVGGGGGASVIVPGAAESLKLPYSRARDAEVVSAVGVAMAMMKNVIEKSVVDPSENDIKQIRSEIIRSMMESGADPETIEVEVEVDKQKNVVRATATGTTALVAARREEKPDAAKAAEIAAASLGAGAPELNVVFEDDFCRVFAGMAQRRGFLGIGLKKTSPVVVVDAYGIAKLTLRDAETIVGRRERAAEELKKAVERATTFGDGGPVVKPAYLVFAGRVIELSKVGDPQKMIAFAEMEIADHSDFDSFCIVLKK